MSLYVVMVALKHDPATQYSALKQVMDDLGDGLYLSVDEERPAVLIRFDGTIKQLHAKVTEALHDDDELIVFLVQNAICNLQGGPFEAFRAITQER